MGQSIDAEIRGRKREDSIHRHTGWKPPGSLVAWQGTGYAWAARPEGAVVLSVDENGTGEDALSCQQSSLPRGGTYDFAKGTTGVVFDPSPTVRAAATSTQSTLEATIAPPSFDFPMGFLELLPFSRVRTLKMKHFKKTTGIFYFG